MPVEMNVDTRELDRYLGLLNTEGLAIVGAEFGDTLNDVLEYLQMLVVDKTPVNYGTLRGSIYTEVRGAEVSNRGVEMTGIVSSSDNALKVEAMERGRTAGKMPPIEAIALWVKRKDIIDLKSFKSDISEWKSSLRSDIKSRKKSGQRVARLQAQLKTRKSDIVERRIMQVAYLIARAIAQGRSAHQLKGGDQMFSKAAEAGEAYAEHAFEQMLDRILAAWAAM